MTTATIESQAAIIMSDILKDISEAAERHQARIAEEAARRLRVEAEQERNLFKAQGYFISVFQKAIQGCRNILNLLDESPSLQKLIAHLEQKKSGLIFSRFSLFSADALGKDENGYDDISLYLNVLSEKAIQLQVGCSQNMVPDFPIITNDDCKRGPEILQSIFFGRGLWKSVDKLQLVARKYRNLHSPRSWHIPIDHYRGDWPGVQIIGLKVLEQCSRPIMLGRYMNDALSRIPH